MTEARQADQEQAGSANRKTVQKGSVCKVGVYILLLMQENGMQM